MPFLLDLRAGRTAGKAARIYKDVMGEAPRPHQAEYLQNMGYYTDNHYALAFELLFSRLRRERIAPDGGTEVVYMECSDPLTKKIVQTLNWIIQSGNVPSDKAEELQILLYEMGWEAQ